MLNERGDNRNYPNIEKYHKYSNGVKYNAFYVVLIDSLHYATTCSTYLIFLAEAFRCHVHHFQQLTGELQPVPPGPSSIENDAHGIEKLLLKIKVS